MSDSDSVVPLKFRFIPLYFRLVPAFSSKASMGQSGFHFGSMIVPYWLVASSGPMGDLFWFNFGSILVSHRFCMVHWPPSPINLDFT